MKSPAEHRLEMIQQHRAREIRDADRFRQALAARRPAQSRPSVADWILGSREALGGLLLALGGRTRNNGRLSRT
jgi:hypothetical protein